MVFNNLNYYEVLEVNADSTAEEIKSAYRRLARKYHPDINKEKDSIEKFKMITLAYETLSNPQEREKYNILKGIFKTSDTTENTLHSKKQKKNIKHLLLLITKTQKRIMNLKKIKQKFKKEIFQFLKQLNIFLQNSKKISEQKIIKNPKKDKI